MPGKALKRSVTAVTARTIKGSTQLIQNLASSSPDHLRETLFKALSALPPDECGRARDKILSDLRRAGLNISSGLVKLGILAETPDELSPSDIAKLVRYVRLNRPEAMKYLERTLTDLMALKAQKVEGVKPIGKAA